MTKKIRLAHFEDRLGPACRLELRRLHLFASVIENDFEAAHQLAKEVAQDAAATPEDAFNSSLAELVIEFGTGGYQRCRVLLDSTLAGMEKSARELTLSLLDLTQDKLLTKEIAERNRLGLPDPNGEGEQQALRIFAVIQKLEENIALSHNHIDRLYLIGVLKVLIEFNNEALQNIDECIEGRRFQNWRQYYWRGVILLRLGDVDQAHKSFLLAQNLVDKTNHVGQLQVVEARIAALVALGEGSRAKGILEHFVEISDKEGEGLELFGDIFFAEGNYEAADDFYQKAKNGGPGSAEVIGKLLSCALGSGNLKKGKSAAKQLCRVWPWRHFDKLLVKSLQALAELNVVSAEKYVQKAKFLGDARENKTIFRSYHAELYGIGACFLRKDYAEALERVQNLLVDLTGRKQSLQLSRLETVPAQDSFSPETEEELANLLLWTEELSHLKVILLLLTGKEAEFWEQIKHLDFGLHENLKLLESADFREVPVAHPIELRFAHPQAKSLELGPPISVSVNGQPINVHFSVSLPLIRPKGISLKVERWLPVELDARFYGLPFQHPLMGGRLLYVRQVPYVEREKVASPKSPSLKFV